MDTAHLIQQITQQHAGEMSLWRCVNNTSQTNGDINVKGNSDFGSQIVIRLSTKWPSVVTPMDKYDQMLPLSLPNER
jgi:hypothetical protein